MLLSIPSIPSSPSSHMRKQLAFNVSICSVRSRKDLVDCIRHKLKDLIHFDQLNLALVNEDDQTLTFFLNYSERKIHENFQGIGKSCHTIHDGLIDSTLEADSPVVWEMQDLLTWKHVPEYIACLADNGISKVVSISLKHGGGRGCLLISTTEDRSFSMDELALMDAVGQQLSVAVLNIIMNEEIRRKDLGKEMLLSLGHQLSVARNKKQLARILKEQLKKMAIFSDAMFNDIVITLFNERKDQHHVFLQSSGSARSLHPDFQSTNDARSPFGKELINKIVRGEDPVIFDVEELLIRDNIPAYISFFDRTGIREFAGIVMHKGEEILGCVFIASEQRNNYQEKDFGLLRGIADQLSFAIVNILANEEILEREEEKSILLALGNNIAMVRNKADLHKIVNERLKKILPISHMLTGTISEDGKWYSAFLLDPQSPSKGHPDYGSITGEKIPVKDGILDHVLASDQPVIFDLDELMKRSKVPRYLKMNHECGIREVVFCPLTTGAHKTGVLVIFSKTQNHLDANHLSLIQGICSQLSTAIANILANEKIEQQFQEISKYKQQLESENLYLQEEIQTTHNYIEIIGTSAGMRKVFQLVSQVAATQSSVLILGETGTGKELIARALHNTSQRKDKVMVKVNCATLPANLIESELFGHERGSFTGATDRRIGKFELANNSTLFLDEVGELPLDLQVKLLRALQEKEIERVGGRTVIKTDVRIIAATNRNLQKEVQQGNFRSDLYFRLNVFPIMIPPLRDRKEDIPSLAAHFLLKHAKKGGKGVMNFSSRVIKELMAYSWPGNVRELEHLIERSILLTTGTTISQIHLPGAGKEDTQDLLPDTYIKTIDEVEREHIISVLKKCNGKVAGIGGAAEKLKIPSTTLTSKMRRLNIRKGYIDK